MSIKWRIRVVGLFFLLFGGAILFRLFYWQVLNRNKLVSMAYSQYNTERTIPSSRGQILSSDGFPLATNKQAYLLYASLNELEEDPDDIAEKIAPILYEEKKTGEKPSENNEVVLNKEQTEAVKDQKDKDKGLDQDTDADPDPDSKVDKDEAIAEYAETIASRLHQEDLVWTALEHKISPETKQQLEELDIKGLGFEKEDIRFYPEASMAGHLVGFLGKNKEGQDVGYFGLEGNYDIELKGRPGVVTAEKDAANNPILFGGFNSQKKIDGQDLVLNIDRAVQYLVDKKLKKGIKQYGAKSGSVVIMDPETGGVIAMSSIPRYDPNRYWEEEKGDFKNPVIASTYEPGSTLKVLVMAGAIEEGVVQANTPCPICDGPVEIGKYQIKTWNEKYHPQSTMTEVIVNSDNTGMVYAGRQLGVDKLYTYIEDFGFGEETGIDLQEEVPARIRPKKDWGEIELATASFGQGIAVTRMQMVRAVSAIANGGKLMQPQVVDRYITTQKEIDVKPKVEKQVISRKTAETIKEMMVKAVEEGGAKWTKLDDYKIAGKTGTAQIPVAGHYDKEKTITSFVGFGPADDAEFVMLVTLREPTTSPWGSETAAPLFFDIAEKLLIYYGVQPE
jgi:cell division protein FtsI/penicillin-binding protein 2